MGDKKLDKIALGGGCHWCTEAVFQSLKGVIDVQQGYVASDGDNSSFSEAVIVQFNPDEIGLYTLILIHLQTHKSTSEHSMRYKYRSAIYYFSEEQMFESLQIIKLIKVKSSGKIITKVLPFVSFKSSRKEITNYFYKNPTKPFCEKFINPKLQLLMENFSDVLDTEKVRSAQLTGQNIEP